MACVVLAAALADSGPASVARRSAAADIADHDGGGDVAQREARGGRRDRRLRSEAEMDADADLRPEAQRNLGRRRRCRRPPGGVRREAQPADRAMRVSGPVRARARPVGPSRHLAGARGGRSSIALLRVSFEAVDRRLGRHRSATRELQQGYSSATHELRLEIQEIRHTDQCTFGAERG